MTQTGFSTVASNLCPISKINNHGFILKGSLLEYARQKRGLYLQWFKSWKKVKDENYKNNMPTLLI